MLNDLEIFGDGMNTEEFKVPNLTSFLLSLPENSEYRLRYTDAEIARLLAGLVNFEDDAFPKKVTIDPNKISTGVIDNNFNEELL